MLHTYQITVYFESDGEELIIIPMLLILTPLFPPTTIILN